MCDEIELECDQNLVHWDDGFGVNDHFSSPEEIENSLSSFDEGFGFRSSKRIKFSPSNQQEEEEIDTSEQSSPLGLTLRKSPSLISLVEMKLSAGRQTNTPTNMDCKSDKKKPKSKLEDFGSQPMSEKLKASNFRALFLKIGTWERQSIHDGDLVAKCYYAKRKLVWEVLEGALKSKIEIQWSDIVGIRATIIDDQPGVLEIELDRPPLFFRETNPQPRKHTLWQPASDFTGGQAPLCRKHYVRFPPGTLEKHYEKLLQCDQRLLLLSQRPFPCQQSPYFDANSYGLSEFSLDFNGYGSQFCPGLRYPYQSFPDIPMRDQNWRQTTRPPLRIMDSNSSVSVNDFMLENRRRASWGESNLAKENYSRPIITQSALANLDFPRHIIDSMTCEGLKCKSKADDGLISHIENHLLGDSSMEYENASSMHPTFGVEGARSLYPSLDRENRRISMEQMMQVVDNATTHAGLAYYSEPMNCVPYSSGGGVVIQSVTNNSIDHPSYPYAFSSFPMKEEYLTLNTNQNI